jgi:hypothetical protein
VTRWLVLLLVGCGYDTHVPNITDLCPRAELEAYTAGPEECITLWDVNGLTLFKLSTSDSCGGPDCLELGPGETGYALEKIKPGEPAQWGWYRGPCESAPTCPID